MRVLWLSHFYPYPPAGGALQRSYHLLRQVASKHDVSLVSLTKSRNRPGFDDAGGCYPEPDTFCTRVDSFPIPAEKTTLHRAWLLGSGVVSTRPYDERWLESEELDAFLRAIDDQASSYDLVHVDTVGLMQYEDVLPGDRIVLNHHNIESHMMHRRADQHSNPLARWYLDREAQKLRRLEADVCGRCAVNLVVSDLEAQRLQEVVESSAVEVVPNGVDVEYFAPSDLGKTRGQDGLVFVGRLSWYPNQDAVEWFLDAIWPTLARERPDRTFTLVGSSPPAKAQEYSGPGTVEATGFVPDVRPYMEQSQIYVCPIRTGGGTRLKILDAMAMGMPLVATAMSVEGLGLEEDRHFLRAESPDEFVEAIAELEQNDRLRKRLAIQAREEAVARFSWSTIGDQLNRAYQMAGDNPCGRV